MSTRAKLQIIKSERDKIPKHFVQTILVRLAKTQQLVGSSFEIRKNGQLFYSLNFGRGGGRGLLVPLKRGVVVVFVKHGLLRVSFFCGNAMQSNRVKKVKNSCMVCISFELNSEHDFKVISPPFPSLFWAFPLSLTLLFLEWILATWWQKKSLVHHCKDFNFWQDYLNMIYFERKFQTCICIIIYCNIFLIQIWIFSTFKPNILKYYRNISNLAIIQTIEFGSYYRVCTQGINVFVELYIQHFTALKYSSYLSNYYFSNLWCCINCKHLKRDLSFDGNMFLELIQKVKIC